MFVPPEGRSRAKTRRQLAQHPPSRGPRTCGAASPSTSMAPAASPAPVRGWLCSCTPPGPPPGQPLPPSAPACGGARERCVRMVRAGAAGARGARIRWRVRLAAPRAPARLAQTPSPQPGHPAPPRPPRTCGTAPPGSWPLRNGGVDPPAGGVLRAAADALPPLCCEARASRACASCLLLLPCVMAVAPEGWTPRILALRFARVGGSQHLQTRLAVLLPPPPKPPRRPSPGLSSWPSPRT